MSVRNVGVVGAASYVGHAIVRLLGEADCAPLSFSRRDQAAENGQWRRLSDMPAEHIALWIDVGPIWKFHERREAMKLRGARKIVATSSTSRFTKSALGNAKEMETARMLAQGEDDFSDWCEENGIEWVILRPTLIYGLGKDKNIREIAAMIRRFGMFPVFGSASGKRQPIHAEDLAQACVAALLSAVSNKSYNASGGEVLTYRAMVQRVFLAMERKPIMPTVPLPLFRAMLAVLNRAPRFAHWTPEMAERMNIDMVFDHSDAREDFGFSPRTFQLHLDDVT